MFSAIIEADITENRMLNVDGSIWVKELGLTKDSLFTETVKAVAERFIAKKYADDFLKYYDIDKLKSDYENGIEEFSHISYQYVGDEYRWTEFSSRVYFSRISGTLRITTFLKDLDDEIKTKERLTYIAVTDSLTGLLNRKSTMERIEKCLSSSENNSKHVLLFIDLDSFKQINDSKGHPFGDEVLKSVAGKLKMIFRRDDIIGRIGGDEFMVLLKNISSREEAEERAKHIFCGRPFSYIWEGTEEFITCSIGASLYTSGKTFDKLYAEADEAMYRAKKEGKNRLVFY